MKKQILFLALILCLLVCPSALAAGRITPLYPEDMEAHEHFWTYMEETLAPWLAENPQEKWSAERCRQVADKLEEGGFVIPEAYKDKLYREKRTHRWHATEAMSILISSQIGEQWQWSLYDMAMSSHVRDLARIISSHSKLPGEGEPGIEDVVKLCRDVITTEYGLTGEEFDAYDLNISLISYGSDDLWTINLTPDKTIEFWESELTFEYYTPSDKWDVMDWRAFK